MDFGIKLARSTSDSQLKNSFIPQHKLSYTAKLQTAQKAVRRKSPLMAAASENFIVQKIKQSKARNLRSLNKLLDSLPNKFTIDDAGASPSSQTTEPFAFRERLNNQLIRSLRVLKELTGVLEFNFDLVENQQPCYLEQALKLLAGSSQPSEADVLKNIKQKMSGPCALCGCCCRQPNTPAKVLDLTEFCVEDKCASCGIKFLTKAAKGICRQCEILPETSPCDDGTLNLLLQVNQHTPSISSKPSPLRSRMRGLSGITDKRTASPTKMLECIRDDNCSISIEDVGVTLTGRGPHIVKLQIRQIPKTSAPATPSFSAKPTYTLNPISPAKRSIEFLEVSFSESLFTTEESEAAADNKRLIELSHAIKSINGKASNVYAELQTATREQIGATNQGLRAMDVCQTYVGHYSRCLRNLLRVTGSLSSELALALNLLFDGMLLLIDYSLVSDSKRAS